MKMEMQTNLNDNNAKKMQERKSNNNAILIYEKIYGSKLICKCKNETSWWKPWMQERVRQEDRSSPQNFLLFKLLLQKSLSKPTT